MNECILASAVNVAHGSNPSYVQQSQVNEGRKVTSHFLPSFYLSFSLQKEGSRVGMKVIPTDGEKGSSISGKGQNGHLRHICSRCTYSNGDFSQRIKTLPKNPSPDALGRMPPSPLPVSSSSLRITSPCPLDSVADLALCIGSELLQKKPLKNALGTTEVSTRSPPRRRLAALLGVL